MKLNTLFHVVLFSAFLLFSAPLVAQAMSNTSYTAKAQSYLQNLKTAKASFIQTNHDGSQLAGTFYLNRPGKLRFDYDGSDDFVVADGYFIYFYDSELEQQTNAPIGQTLADFILRDNLTLSGDVAITDVKRAGGYVQMTLTQTSDPAAGKIILAFADDAIDGQTFELRKWRVIDPQGLITEVELIGMQSPAVHKAGLFHYFDPKREEKREKGMFNE